MFQRRIPDWVRHAPNPGLRGFALLAALDSAARGLLISVLPLAMYHAFRDAQLIAAIYLSIGILSLIGGLLVPVMMRIIPRRWMYTIGALLYLLGAAFGVFGPPEAVALVILFNSLATVTITVCFNAYVLDYVARVQLGKAETLRLFYSALAWTVGPFAGVAMHVFWRPLPFLAAGLAAAILLITFWVMRLGNGKLIQRARAPAPNPVAYLGRFLQQPRLITGWSFAVMRSCGWWAYAVYLPIFTIEYGLGEKIAGLALSLSYAFLFSVPLMLKLLEKTSVKTGIRLGFLLAGLGFVLASPAAFAMPSAALAILFASTAFLVLLDVCGGLPFLLAVKPSERTEMSAVYSSYRDVSNIVSPAAAWLVLLVAPVPFVFAAVGCGLLSCWAMAGKLHPRLGSRRLKPSTPLAPSLKEVVEQPLRGPRGH